MKDNSTTGPDSETRSELNWEDDLRATRILQMKKALCTKKRKL